MASFTHLASVDRNGKIIGLSLSPSSEDAEASPVDAASGSSIRTVKLKISPKDLDLENLAKFTTNNIVDAAGKLKLIKKL